MLCLLTTLSVYHGIFTSGTTVMIKKLKVRAKHFKKDVFKKGYFWKVFFSFVLMWFVVAVFAGYAVVRTWNFHIWNNGNDQETGRKSQTFQRNTALINGNTFAFDEQHCKCFLFSKIFTLGLTLWNLSCLEFKFDDTRLSY